MFDIAHFIQRFMDPFNTESRFYWPVVIAVFVATVVHTLWYVFKPNRPRHPVRNLVESVAYWIDIVALVLFLVFLSAKATAWVLVALLVIEWLGLAYVFFVYAPPQFAAYAREERRRKFIREPKRRAARR